jgi:hypothetical protein
MFVVPCAFLDMKSLGVEFFTFVWNNTLSNSKLRAIYCALVDYPI